MQFDSPFILANNQTVVCKELQLAQPIETYLAVEVNDEGKLVPTADTTKMVGVAAPQFGVIPPSTILTPIADFTDLYVAGVAIGTVSEAVTAGTKLTLDVNNPGYFKPAAATDPVVAIALTNGSQNDKVRILLL